MAADDRATQDINALRPRQNDRRFADDTFKRIFLNENVRISTKISPKFVPKGPINYTPALVHIMAWRRSGDKPLSEPMIVSWITHICVTRPHWVKTHHIYIFIPEYSNPSTRRVIFMCFAFWCVHSWVLCTDSYARRSDMRRTLFLKILLSVGYSYLTYWSRVTHICVIKLTIIG